jgi:hypothetical protein
MDGIIKYQLDYSPAPSLPASSLAEINAWRQLLHATKLIGQDPNRYGGYGYGNLSRRIEPFEAPVNCRAFVISGTQTGGLAMLAPEHYTTVIRCSPDQNRIVSAGPIKPSSESLTHGSVYDQDADLRWVLHVHSPEIWRHAEELGVPTTLHSVPYGCPEMAAEVQRLFGETDVRERRIFAMGGHEDGIVAFGQTGEEAACVLFSTLVKANVLEEGA